MAFPPQIKNFSVVFRTLQAKRHDADYDPYQVFFKTDVQNDIAAARRAISQLSAAPLKDRRAFVALVLLKDAPP
jgi:hypothetical protein